MRLYLHCKTGQVPNRPVYELLVVCAKGLSWLLTRYCYCLVSMEGKRRVFSSRLEKMPNSPMGCQRDGGKRVGSLCGCGK